MAKQNRICLYGASDAFVAAINARIVRESSISKSDNTPSCLSQPTSSASDKNTGINKKKK